MFEEIISCNKATSGVPRCRKSTIVFTQFQHRRMAINHKRIIGAKGGHHGVVIWWNDASTWGSGIPSLYTKESAKSQKNPRGGKHSCWSNTRMGCQISKGSHLVRKDRVVVEVERVYLRLYSHNYIYLSEQLANTIAIYSRQHNGLYFVVHKQAWKQESLEITKDITLQYVIAPTKAHMKFSCLWISLQSSSKSILTEALEVNMWFAADFLVQIKFIAIEFRV